jgi:hypothetical protein
VQSAMQEAPFVLETPKRVLRVLLGKLALADGLSVAGMPSAIPPGDGYNVRLMSAWKLDFGI